MPCSQSSTPAIWREVAPSARKTTKLLRRARTLSQDEIRLPIKASKNAANPPMLRIIKILRLNGSFWSSAAIWRRSYRLASASFDEREDRAKRTEANELASLRVVSQI